MNLLLTGAWAEAKDHIAALEAMGHRVLFQQQEAEPLVCAPSWVEGAVCNALFLHHRLEEFTNLRYLQLTSAGTDRVDTELLEQKHVALRTARGVYSVPMAEFALSGVLQLYKQAGFFRANQATRRWEKHRGLRELYGRRVLILGCGSVGTACAVRFEAMGCRVLGVDLCPRQTTGFAAVYPLDRLDDLLPEAEVLLLTLPLTAQTRGLLDGRRLGLLPEGAVLVNISRGPVAVERDLIRALQTGKLWGAVLDVFETEPLPPDCPLWAMEQVILTPHNSFVGEGNARRLTEVILAHLTGYDNRRI